MKFLIYALLISVSIFFVACSKDEATISNPTDGLFKIAEGYAPGSGMKAGIYAKSATIYTGYQQFFILLTDSITGNIISNAQVQLNPLMNMGTMQHSSPFENPGSSAINSLFPCSAVFIMPSSAGAWSLNVQITDPRNGSSGNFNTPLTILEPSEANIKSFTSLSNGANYFVALVSPEAPRVGINDFEIAVYRKNSMMSFPADSSLSVSIYPEMPTMGHSSPNNIDPAHVGKGHYKGKVNFTMTGYWKVNLDFMSGAEVADSTQYFDITF